MAKGAPEVHSGHLLRVVVVVVAEQDRGHAGQLRVQRLGQHAVLLQQGAAVCRVGALGDRLPVPDFVLIAAGLSLEGGVREGAGHDAVNEVNRLRLLSLAGLEGVGLDVLDGARVDLVAEAFVGSVVARELGL